MKNLSDQQKGSLMAFVAVMFITPDSLFIRLSNVDTWGLVFYRGIIPFIFVLLGMLLIYKLNFFKILFSSGYHGLLYIGTFSLTNITFVVSIQNTNVANTLVMIAMAPMLSAILGGIFLKELKKVIGLKPKYKKNRPIFLIKGIFFNFLIFNITNR